MVALALEERVRGTDVYVLRVAISWPRGTKEGWLAEINVIAKSPLPKTLPGIFY